MTKGRTFATFVSERSPGERSDTRDFAAETALPLILRSLHGKRADR
jgi:hypothetical protein